MWREQYPKERAGDEARGKGEGRRPVIFLVLAKALKKQTKITKMFSDMQAMFCLFFNALHP